MDKKKKQETPAQPAEEKTEGAAHEGQLEQEPEKTSEPEKTPAQPDPLEVAKAEAEDFKRKWYSVTAEYENYRKRTARESARRYEEGRADASPW